LPFTLAQARKTNSTARIVLLGDMKNRIKGIQYEHREIPKDSERRRRLKKAYVHLNHSNYDHEYTCIERWLVLADFLEDKVVGPFWFLDTDAVLFTDLSCLQQKLQGQAAGTPNLFATCFCPNAELVVQLSNWIICEYENPANLREWEDKFRRHCLKSTDGGVVTDMAVIWAFEKKFNVKLLDLRKPRKGWAVDSGEIGGSFFKSTRKKSNVAIIQSNKGLTLKKEDKHYHLAIIHLHGYDKSHISVFVSWTWPIFYSFFREPYIRNLRSLIKYWFRGLRIRKSISVLLMK